MQTILQNSESMASITASSTNNAASGHPPLHQSRNDNNLSTEYQRQYSTGSDTNQHIPVQHHSSNSVMERVLFQLHQRACHFGLQQSTTRTRRFMEHVLLVVAIAGFAALILLHKSFVFRPASNAAQMCLSSIPNFDWEADIHHVSILSTEDYSSIQQSRVYKTYRTEDSTYSHQCTFDATGERTCSPDSSSLPAPLYSYSNTKAFLMLPKDHEFLTSLRIQHIVLAPSDPECFGEPFLQTILHQVVGYDTLALNWLLALLSQAKQETNTSAPVGHVYHWGTGQLQELKLPPSSTSSATDSPPNNSETSWIAQNPFLFSTRLRRPLNLLSKLSVLIKTSFLFFFSTTLVSFTLRKTQQRMVEFTQELSRRVRMGLPLVDLVLFHLIHNMVFVPIMVGMMFFLIEFYPGDKFLAFSIMSMVWCVEVFSVISLRTYQGMNFFPKMFFLLFCLFHIYYFANPYGFPYVALMVAVCFMWHSVFFFWHRYELPAVAMGRVTVDRPRIHFYMAPVSSSPGSHLGIPTTPSGTTTMVHSPPPFLPDPSAHPTPSTQPSNSDISNALTPQRAGGSRRASSDPPSPPQIRLARSPPASNDTMVVSGALFNETMLIGDITLPDQPTTMPELNTTAMQSTGPSSNSLHSSSRVSSSSILGTAGAEDDDSCVYFMKGEVVVHRNPDQLTGQTDNGATTSSTAARMQQQEDAIGLDMSTL